MLKTKYIQPSRLHWRDLLFSWGPALLWMAVIFYFSSQNTIAQGNGSPGSKLIRKSAHIIEYSVLGILIGQALWTTWLSLGRAASRTLMARVWKVGLILTTLYAASDEIHQLFVPRREFRPTDILIDGLSATAALGIWYIVRARKPTPTS